MRRHHTYFVSLPKWGSCAVMNSQQSQSEADEDALKRYCPLAVIATLRSCYSVRSSPRGGRQMSGGWGVYSLRDSSCKATSQTRGSRVWARLAGGWRPYFYEGNKRFRQIEPVGVGEWVIARLSLTCQFRLVQTRGARDSGVKWFHAAIPARFQIRLMSTFWDAELRRSTDGGHRWGDGAGGSLGILREYSPSIKVFLGYSRPASQRSTVALY